MNIKIMIQVFLDFKIVPSNIRSCSIPVDICALPPVKIVIFHKNVKI